MTFDEWWEVNCGDDAFDGEFHKPRVRKAWEAAAAAERERCATHVESAPPQHALDRIRGGDAVVIAPAAVWTTTPPDREGWYWWRAQPGVPADLRRVSQRLTVTTSDEVAEYTYAVADLAGEWWPIPLEAPPC